jgi:hypothetical protein
MKPQCTHCAGSAQPRQIIAAPRPDADHWMGMYLRQKLTMTQCLNNSPGVKPNNPLNAAMKADVDS